MRLTRSRCQGSTVCGETGKHCHGSRGTSPLAAASRIRSRRRSGRRRPLESTRTSWRRTRISKSRATSWGSPPAVSGGSRLANGQVDEREQHGNSSELGWGTRMVADAATQRVGRGFVDPSSCSWSRQNNSASLSPVVSPDPSTSTARDALKLQLAQGRRRLPAFLPLWASPNAPFLFGRYRPRKARRRQKALAEGFGEGQRIK